MVVPGTVVRIDRERDYRNAGTVSAPPTQVFATSTAPVKSWVRR